ncbi:MAG: hypothetical protein WDW38_007689 [Sanguina aurantia]
MCDRSDVSPQEQSAAPKEKYDVYVNEPQPLREGEEKHTISVFVADEAGLINRVAGVFARRAANIESLAVGLSVDKALFTIVTNGSAGVVRELLLIKLNAAAGEARTELLQLIQIFRARVADVSDTTVTLAVSGDPGKLAAIQMVMAKFGIAEVSRTGRICLKRGESLLETSRLAPEGRSAAETATAKAVANSIPAPQPTGGADVYAVDDGTVKGVWEVGNILDSTYSGKKSQFEARTLSILVQDVPGVLNMVTGVFARRGYNVQSLAVGPSEVEGESRICIVVPGTTTGTGFSNLVKQLLKLVSVQSVTDLTSTPFVNRELMLVKVRCTAGQRGELRDLASIFRGGIIDVSRDSVVMEVMGKEDKLKAFTGRQWCWAQRGV